jgi:hypothetical protein
MTRVLLVTLFFTVATARAASEYTREMFRRGLYEPGVLVTSAPLFVLITLRDPDSGAERAAAVPGNFLLGAIDMEYHLKPRKTSKQDEGKALAELQQKELEITLSQPNRVFVFRNRRARNNVEPRYTPVILAEVRRAVAAKSRKDLVRATRANESWLHRIYESKRDAIESFAYRDAVAHALLERGILVGHGDYTGGLYVATK